MLEAIPIAMTFDSFAGIAPIAQLAIGAALLLFGRKLFWLFVAVAGFLFGWHLGANLLAGQSGLILIAAILLGVIGAVLAVLLQKTAIILAGGVAGGLFAMRFAESLASPLPLVVFAVAAILAAIVAIFLFDWALVFFSSLTGAALILEPMALAYPMKAVFWIILLAVGILVQSYSLRARAAEVERR